MHLPWCWWLVRGMGFLLLVLFDIPVADSVGLCVQQLKQVGRLLVVLIIHRPSLRLLVTCCWKRQIIFHLLVSVFLGQLRSGLWSYQGFIFSLATHVMVFFYIYTFLRFATIVPKAKNR